MLSPRIENNSEGSYDSLETGMVNHSEIWANQSAWKISLGLGIFIIQFRPICWERKIFLNLAKEVLCIYWIQAPNMMHMMMFTNSFTETFIRKKASCVLFVFSRIHVRHDHCKWKVLGSVGSCQNIQHQLFWSHPANHEILVRSSAGHC